MGTGGFGFGNAWSSYSLPDLTDCENNPQKPEGCTFDAEFTEEEGSWIGYMYTLGQVFSLPIAGAVMAASPSRRLVMLVMSLIFLAGWTLVALTLDEIYWFYIGRFILGLGAGALGLIGVLYIHESVEPSVRGGLGNFPVFVLVLAYFFGNLFGAIMPWYVVTYIGFFFPGKNNKTGTDPVVVAVVGADLTTTDIIDCCYLQSS